MIFRGDTFGRPWAHGGSSPSPPLETVVLGASPPPQGHASARLARAERLPRRGAAAAPEDGAPPLDDPRGADPPCVSSSVAVVVGPHQSMPSLGLSSRCRAGYMIATLRWRGGDGRRLLAKATWVAAIRSRRVTSRPGAAAIPRRPKAAGPSLQRLTFHRKASSSFKCQPGHPSSPLRQPGDVSVVATCSQNALGHGLILARREQAKHRRYRGEGLVPFVVDVRDKWGCPQDPAAAQQRRRWLLAQALQSAVAEMCLQSSGAAPPRGSSGYGAPAYAGGAAERSGGAGAPGATGHAGGTGEGTSGAGGGALGGPLG